MAEPAPIQPVSARFERVYADLSVRISRGELVAGQRLPAEPDLAIHYGVSRRSVRLALDQLAVRGQVERRQGSGTYIAAGLSGESAPADRPADRSLAIYLRAPVDVLAENASDPWSRAIGEGLRRSAAAHGYALFNEVVAPDSNPAPPPLDPARLAGIVIFPAGVTTPAQLMPGLPAGVPRVVINRPSDDPAIPSFVIGNEAGAFDVVSALFRLGHRRIMMFPANWPTYPFRLRLAGYRRAHLAAGIPIDPLLLPAEPAIGREPEWPRHLPDALERAGRPTALLLNAKDHPNEFLAVLRAAGYRVPQDISVVCLDDDPRYADASPSLAAMSLPLAEMGRLAIDALHHARTSPPAPGVTYRPRMLRPSIILRESIGLPRA